MRGGVHFIHISFPSSGFYCIPYKLLIVRSILLSVLAGKLAAEVVSERAANLPYSGSVKAIEPSIVEKALRAKPKDPVGVLGEGAIAFGVSITQTPKSM